MVIIEQFVEGKHDLQSKCEDRLVVSKQYVAVIDGATAKGRKKINKMLTGNAIANSISHFLTTNNDALSGAELINALSEFIRKNLLIPHGLNKISVNSPTASIAVYTIKKKTITVVGDINVMIDKSLKIHATNFDRIVSQVRSIVNCITKEQNMSIIDNKGIDVGRKFIMPLLKQQHYLRNSNTKNPWAYGNVDGFSVPDKFIKLYKVKKNQEIVFCSDGYPIVEDTLRKSEKTLKRILQEDPLQTFKYYSTKGKLHGLKSFDDRCYIRFIT